MKRALERDFKERGKAIKKAEDDFLRSWDIYYKKLRIENINNNVNQFTIEKNTNINQILKKVFE